MFRRLSSAVLALCVTFGVGCGSTRSALAGRDAETTNAGGASADTYITADQSSGVNAVTTLPASGAAAVDVGQGIFIAP